MSESIPPDQEKYLATVVYVALAAEISRASAASSLKIWAETVQPYAIAKAPEHALWLSRAVLNLLSWRKRAARLGISFFKLIEALEAGGDSAEQARRSFSLAIYNTRASRSYDLGRGLDLADPSTSAKSSDASEYLKDLGQTLSDLDLDIVTDLDEEIAKLEAEQAADEERDRLEAEAFLSVLGTESLIKRNQAIARVRDMLVGDKEALENHRDAGAKQASVAAKIALDGGRKAVLTLIKGGKGDVAWARVTASPDPCGFCRMLMSRGAVYLTEESATGHGNGFHPNCKCVAIPVASNKDFLTNQAFARNREMQKLWPIVTEGYSGKDALRVWREYWRSPDRVKDNSRGQEPPITVQEAA